MDETLDMNTCPSLWVADEYSTLPNYVEQTSLLPRINVLVKPSGATCNLACS